MNKQLLNTKINSLKHYRAEIQRLKEAIKLNEELKLETEKSLIEFFPFEPNDIVFYKGQMIKIDQIERGWIDEQNEIRFKVIYFKQSSGSGFERSTTYDTWTLEYWNSWNKIN